MRLSEAEVKQFLFAQRLHAFDPGTLARVATVEYRPDWTCTAKFESGGSDEGSYGLDGELYWTEYREFREGARHRFFLHRVSDETAQAVFEDGTPAFLQSSKPQIS